jgi:2-methylcitrate dehydratase PrpD
MRERVDLVADPDLTFGRSRVTVVSSDGKTVSVQTDAAKGAPGNSATTEDLCAKFNRCAAGRLSQSESNELLESLTRIDQLDDLSRFFSLLRAASERVH